MKRKEMLKLIEEAIANSDYQGWYEDIYLDIIAEAALKACEEAEMLPPRYYEKVEDYYQKGYEVEVARNKWEPEE